MSLCHKNETGHAWVERPRADGAYCAHCKTPFPCRTHCDHVDCRQARGESEPPSGVEYPAEVVS